MANSEKIEMRKIIPVVARISAGKSKLLNVIYNINFLESKSGIATKFINLLRYNPKLNKPKFFRLKIKKIGEKYEFYRDINYGIIEGDENIKNENKKINKMYRDGQPFKYEEIFYMTEINYSPFIKDKNYLLTHDLCDVPGLSEAQTEAETEDNNKIQIDGKGLQNENEKLINKGIKTSNEIEKTEDKKEDEIYYHLAYEKNTYLSEIFKILKDCIDGGIIILSVENYYFHNNFELISRFHKVINKTISNFLIILNKMDLCLDDEESNKTIEKCKGLIMKYFPDCKTFNLNLNTFIPLSTIRLKEELLLKDNFEYLLKYHISNYKLRIKKIQRDKDSSNYITFKNYLKEIIKLEEEIEKIDINKTQTFTDADRKTIKDILNKIDKDKDYNDEDVYLDLINSNNNDSQSDIDDVIKYLFLYHKDGKLIPLPSEETYNIVEYFKTGETILQTEETTKKK